MAFLVTNMIINVNIKPEEIANCSKVKLEQFVVEILRCSRSGIHRIVIPRDLATELENAVRLPDYLSSHLRELRQMYTQYKEQTQNAIYICEIVTAKVHTVENKGGRNVLLIGFELILETRFLEEPVLLLENASTDGKLYDIILLQHALAQRFGELRYSKMNGGGGSIGNEVKQIESDLRVFVCVCDTDLRHPYGPKSETFNFAARNISGKRTFAILKGTPGREIENFIPFSIIARLAVQKSKTVSFIDSVIKREGKCCDSFWLYFDLKEGLKDIEKYYACSSSRKWLSEKLSIGLNEINTVQVDGFGENVLSVFINDGSALAEFHQHMRSSNWKSQYEYWFYDMMWLFSGNKKKYT
jgi:hypothetical protein